MEMIAASLDSEFWDSINPFRINGRTIARYPKDRCPPFLTHNP